LVLPAM